MCHLSYLRFPILILGTLCLTAVIANVLIWNFTKLCMLEHRRITPSSLNIDQRFVWMDGVPFPKINISDVTQQSTTASTENFTTPSYVLAPVKSEHRFRWSLSIQNVIFSAFAWGAVITVFPSMWATQRFGARLVFTVFGLLSAASTLLSPLAAYHGYEFFIVCRVIQGFAYSLVMTTIGAIVAHWAPLSENGLFMGLLASVLQLSPTLAMPVSGYFCTSKMGWPAAYYALGIFTLILTILWFMFYKNSPQKHSWITQVEVDRILSGKGLKQKRSAQVVPWKRLLMSGPVWAILIATFGNMFAIQTVILYTPTYLNNILDFNLLSSGILAAMPFFMQFLVKLTAGFVSDWLPFGETNKLRLFNSLSLCGMAVFLGAVAFIPSTKPKLAVAFLILAASILGFHSGGFFKSATLVARQFSPIVMGLVQLLTCIDLIIIPFIKGAIVTDEGNIYQWRILFLIASGLLVVCNVVFCVLCSAEAADWAVPGQVKAQEMNNLQEKMITNPVV